MPLFRFLVKVVCEIDVCCCRFRGACGELVFDGCQGFFEVVNQSHMVVSIARFAEMSSKDFGGVAAYRFQSRVYIFGGVGLWTVVCLYCNTCVLVSGSL